MQKETKDFFVELLTKPVITIDTRPLPETVVNNYYIHNDNRVIKVTEEEFKKIVKRTNAKIEDRTKIIEHNLD